MNLFTNLYIRIVGHWKTTVYGLAGAGLTGLGDYLINGQITAKGAALAFSVALIGALKKTAEQAASDVKP